MTHSYDGHYGHRPTTDTMPATELPNTSLLMADQDQAYLRTPLRRWASHVMGAQAVLEAATVIETNVVFEHTPAKQYDLDTTDALSEERANHTRLALELKENFGYPEPSQWKPPQAPQQEQGER